MHFVPMQCLSAIAHSTTLPVQLLLLLLLHSASFTLNKYSLFSVHFLSQHRMNCTRPIRFIICQTHQMATIFFLKFHCTWKLFIITVCSPYYSCMQEICCRPLYIGVCSFHMDYMRNAIIIGSPWTITCYRLGNLVRRSCITDVYVFM